jgi:hypothetical protein
VKKPDALRVHFSLWNKISFVLLGAGIICFGFLFPDSLSDHDKLVHFSAHFGMSFLLALCCYALCSVKWRIPKTFSYTVLVSVTLTIGMLYKFWEIAMQDMIGNYSFRFILDQTSCLTSLSQNLSGLMAAMLMIESMLDKHLVPAP